VALKPEWIEAKCQLAAMLSTTGQREEAASLMRELEKSGSAQARFIFAAASGATQVPAAPMDYVSSLFDDYAERFDSHLVDTLKYRGPGYLREAVDTVLSAPPRHDQLEVLDLGCGTGLCGDAFRELARRLVGIDLSPGMVEKCRSKKLYDEVRQGNVIDALKGAEFYDIVLAGDVFVHVGALEKIFNGVKRTLRPGGVFAFTAECAEGDAYILQPTLRYAQSENYIRRLAAHEGLEVAHFKERILREEGGRPIRAWVVVLKKPAA
jgi:predicted TPR repeat methyltransferase